MAHIKLRHIVTAMPHGAGLRKRAGRTLKPVKPSHKNELWYKAQLLAIVAQLKAVSREVLLPELKRMEPLYAKATDGIVRDRAAYSHVVNDKIAEARRKLGGIEGVAKRLADAATKRSLNTVDERLAASVKGSVGVDISGFMSRSGPIQEIAAAAQRANIDLITSIPDQYFDKLGDSINKSIEAGVRFDDLAGDVERIGDVTESRAKLIARDQTSKMNGAFNMIRQTSLGIARYTWQTAGDERVREEHQANDGQDFDWNDPPATGHPGEDVNCRCIAIPKFDLDESALEEGQFTESSGAGVGATLAIAGAYFGYAARTAGDAFNPDQPRDEHGRWGSGGGISGHAVSASKNPHISNTHDLGQVNRSNVEAVAKHAKVDIAGFKRTANDTELRHALNSHGSTSKEKDRGQRAITARDLDKLDSITSKPDSVSRSEKTWRGSKCIEYHKVIAGERHVYVEAINERASRVMFVSLRVHTGQQK